MALWFQNRWTSFLPIKVFAIEVEQLVAPSVQNYRNLCHNRQPRKTRYRWWLVLTRPGLSPGKKHQASLDTLKRHSARRAAKLENNKPLRGAGELERFVKQRNSANDARN
jgi:hypothetical protein